MRRRLPWVVAAILAFLVDASFVQAGMGSPLPFHPEKLLRLNEPALMRIQAISFFLLVFLGCVTIVRLLWNHLQKDFPSLPRLSFGKALVGVCLWGLLFVIVLTMISGARELMTPGAWKKQDFNYKLANETPPVEPKPEAVRRQHLEKLRTALWQFAATHEGKFPVGEEITAIPSELLEMPNATGLRYIYKSGKSAGSFAELLVYEPEVDPEQRFALKTNGDILIMRSSSIQSALAQGKAP